MHLDADDLLAQIRTDYPDQYEIARLRLLCHRQAAEISRLTGDNEQLRADLPARGGAPYVGASFPLVTERAADA